MADTLANKQDKELLIYVGRKECPGAMKVRSYELPEGDEFCYELITTTPKKGLTKKLLNEYNLIIGPFKTMKGAERFRDIEGLNSVDEAERDAARKVG